MELQEVNIHEHNPLLFGKAQSEGLEQIIEVEYTVNGTTHKTNLKINVQGNTKCHQAMITFHDIGMNYVSNFSTLFNCEHMEQIRQYFCVYHINAPGQEESAQKLSDNFVYPSMQNLADMIPQVFSKFGLKSAILMGCGAGANVFMRFAMKNPSRVDGLIAVNPIISSIGNLSWIGDKIANFTTPLHEQMLHYHFTREEAEKANHDLIEAHRKHFMQINSHNLQLFIKEYERREDLLLHRSMIPLQPEEESHTLACSTLLVVGDLSPFVEDVVEVNSRLDPAKTTLLKMADAGGMIMEEQMFNVSEALTYFLQGLGHISSVRMSRLNKRTISTGSMEEADRPRIRTFSGGDRQPDLAIASGDSRIGQKHSDKTHLVTGAVC